MSSVGPTEHVRRRLTRGALENQLLRRDHTTSPSVIDQTPDSQSQMSRPNMSEITHGDAAPLATFQHRLYVQHQTVQRYAAAAFAALEFVFEIKKQRLQTAVMAALFVTLATVQAYTSILHNVPSETRWTARMPPNRGFQKGAARKTDILPIVAVQARFHAPGRRVGE